MAWLRIGLHGNVAGSGAFNRAMEPSRFPQRADTPLDGIADLVPEMQQRAPLLDRTAAFPTREVDRLRTLGALAAPVPTALGGLGWGTEPQAALPLMQALRLLGCGNLSVGRLYEAHVNALRLAVRYGGPEQARLVTEDALAGHLFGLWVTDPPDAPLRLGQHGFVLAARRPPVPEPAM